MTSESPPVNCMIMFLFGGGSPGGPVTLGGGVVETMSPPEGVTLGGGVEPSVTDGVNLGGGVVDPPPSPPCWSSAPPPPPPEEVNLGGGVDPRSLPDEVNLGGGVEPRTSLWEAPGLSKWETKGTSMGVVIGSLLWS